MAGVAHAAQLPVLQPEAAFPAGCVPGPGGILRAQGPKCLRDVEVQCELGKETLAHLGPRKRELEGDIAFKHEGYIAFKVALNKPACEKFATRGVNAGEVLSKHLPAVLARILKQKEIFLTSDGAADELEKCCKVLTRVHFQQDPKKCARQTLPYEVVVRIRFSSKLGEEHVKQIKAAISRAERTVVKEHIEHVHSNLPGAQGRSFGNPRVTEVMIVREEDEAREEDVEHHYGDLPGAQGRAFGNPRVSEVVIVPPPPRALGEEVREEGHVTHRLSGVPGAQRTLRVRKGLTSPPPLAREEAWEETCSDWEEYVDHRLSDLPGAQGRAFSNPRSKEVAIVPQPPWALKEEEREKVDGEPWVINIKRTFLHVETIPAEPIPALGRIRSAPAPRQL